MSRNLFFIGVTSAFILASLIVFERLLPRQRQRLAMLSALVLLTFVTLLVFASSSPTKIEIKGETTPVQWVMVGLMYASMSLGIIAQSVYFRDDAKTRITSWVKPALASPIIFIPLLSSYQNVLSALNQISLAEVMILLVSFQNGFFWKVIFDKAETVAKTDSIGGNAVT